MTSRQAGLPVPKPGRNAGHNLPPVHTGRVTHVDYEAGTVDVLLDDGQTVLADVVVLSAQSGPDREVFDLPAPRSLVAVLYAWGTKSQPFVLGVLPRRGKVRKDQGGDTPTEKGAYRRVWPSGAHLAVYADGGIEWRAADGAHMVINATGAVREDFTGQETESWDGDPFKDPAPVAGNKPSGYQLKLGLPDGTIVHLADGVAHVQAPTEVKVDQKDGGSLVLKGGKATLAAPNGITIEQPGQGKVTLDGGTVTMSAPSKIDVKAPTVWLRSGMSGVAIDATGVSLAGPVLKWHNTPLTAIAFPPAGLVTFVPLPAPPPFPPL